MSGNLSYAPRLSEIPITGSDIKLHLTRISCNKVRSNTLIYRILQGILLHTEGRLSKNVKPLVSPKKVSQP